MNRPAAPAESLAIDGGAPVRSAALAPWPYFAEDEIEAARRVLASGKVNYWTGEECTAFEREFAARIGRRRAISLANGTLALELALRALGIGPGDEVVVPARTFIATASCAVACGATPVVADMDPESQNLTAETVRAVLSPRTRALIPVHLGGWPCDMDALMSLARERDLFVIEDCAQAHGAAIGGRPVGAFGHCAAFSFCQDKILTTGGEGGMLLTDDEALWARAWSYKDHGKNPVALVKDEAAPGFRWLHDSFGSNFRLTELQAAIGRVQLGKLDDWLAARERNARLLTQALASAPGLRVPQPGAGLVHARYRLYAFLEPGMLAAGWDHSRVIAAINAEGVPCSVGGCAEIYREKAFAATGWPPARRLPVAQAIGATSLAFLVHPTLTESELHDCGKAVRKVMRAACGG